MPGASPPVWQHWGRVAEALALLALARICIALFPFRVWRRWTGRALPPANPRPHTAIPNADQSESTNCGRDCAVAVQRAANRLPGSLCLPQAMALQWMLRRRKIGCTIVLGLLPGQRRGVLGDLHAWVEAGGIILIGGVPIGEGRPGEKLAGKDARTHRPVLTLVTQSSGRSRTGNTTKRA